MSQAKYKEYNEKVIIINRAEGILLCFNDDFTPSDLAGKFVRKMIKINPALEGIVQIKQNADGGPDVLIKKAAGSDQCGAYMRSSGLPAMNLGTEEATNAFLKMLPDNCQYLKKELKNLSFSRDYDHALLIQGWTIPMDINAIREDTVGYAGYTQSSCAAMAAPLHASITKIQYNSSTKEIKILFKDANKSAFFVQEMHKCNSDLKGIIDIAGDDVVIHQAHYPPFGAYWARTNNVPAMNLGSQKAVDLFTKMLSNTTDVMKGLSKGGAENKMLYFPPYTTETTLVSDIRGIDDTASVRHHDYASLSSECAYVPSVNKIEIRYDHAQSDIKIRFHDYNKSVTFVQKMHAANPELTKCIETEGIHAVIHKAHSIGEVGAYKAFTKNVPAMNLGSKAAATEFLKMLKPCAAGAAFITQGSEEEGKSSQLYFPPSLQKVDAIVDLPAEDYASSTAGNTYCGYDSDLC